MIWFANVKNYIEICRLKPKDTYIMRILRYSLMLILSSLSLIARGGDFVSNGLVYCFGSRSGEVMVVENIIDGLNSYSGVCIIPTTVNYDGDNYKVTAIAELAFADSHVTDVVILLHRIVGWITEII